MNLTRVTITGADDSVKPEALLELSREFPFVEFGILLSPKRVGTPRFPGYEWLLNLYDLADRHSLKLSGHICGEWSHGLCRGKWAMPWAACWLPCMFNRVQLNFNWGGDFSIAALGEVLDRWQKSLVFPPKAFIIQHNDHNEAAFQALLAADYSVVPLFDRSGGRGVLPGQWPIAGPAQIPHGYAGGLGPDNLAEQLPLIAKAAEPAPKFWIDMESGVRSNDDKQFDLEKVRRCLQIAKPFIK